MIKHKVHDRLDFYGGLLLHYLIRVIPLIFYFIIVVLFDNLNTGATSGNLEYNEVLRVIFFLIFAYPVPIMLSRNIYKWKTEKIRQHLSNYYNEAQLMTKRDRINILKGLISIDHTFFTAERAELNIKIFRELQAICHDSTMHLFSDLEVYYFKRFAKIKNSFVTVKQLAYRPILRTREQNLRISFGRAILIKTWMLNEIKAIETCQL